MSFSAHHRRNAILPEDTIVNELPSLCRISSIGLFYYELAFVKCKTVRVMIYECAFSYLFIIKMCY